MCMSAYSSDRSHARLILEAGVEGHLCFQVITPTCVIGSQKGSDVLLANQFISRQHAEILTKTGRYLIRDLGSRNGTFVNGKRILQSYFPLENYARLDLGGSPHGKGHVSATFLEPGATMVNIDTHGLVVDAQFLQVRLMGEIVVDITPTEFRMLSYLFSHIGKPCSFEELIGAGWSNRKEDDLNPPTSADVEQIIKRLRRKIGRHSPAHQYIINVRGFGYRLTPQQL